MARQLFKLPNGKWAEYSTISDGFVAFNVTKDQIIDEAVKVAAIDAKRRCEEVFEDIENGIIRGHFAITLEEAIEKHNSIHAPEYHIDMK